MSPELHEEERSFDPPRSIEVRLNEYRDSLLGMVPQLELIATLVERKGKDASSLRDGIRLHELIAKDLTKIINGEELQQFSITGEL